MNIRLPEKPKFKKADPTFKIINNDKKLTNIQKITQIHDSTILKDMSTKSNINNDTTSTATHSSNNQTSKIKQELHISKLHNLSHSPINYRELKVEKEIATPGKIKSSILNRNNKEYSKIYENKFEELCEEETTNLLKAHEKTIEKLKRQNEKLKSNEKKLVEKIEALEKTKQDLMEQIKVKNTKEKKYNFNFQSKIKKPLMFDQSIQVFINENEENELNERNELLMFYIDSLENKLNEIENNIDKNNFDIMIDKNPIVSEEKNMNSHRNFISELENSMRNLFISNKQNELLYQEAKNERDLLKMIVNSKKCGSCQKEEESLNFKCPIPGYVKLCRLGQDLKYKK